MGRFFRNHGVGRDGELSPDSDDFPAIANPQEAAEVFVQRLIDAGFEIEAQERAPIMNVGAYRQGGAIASAWPPTTQDG